MYSKCSNGTTHPVCARQLLHQRAHLEPIDTGLRKMQKYRACPLHTSHVTRHTSHVTPHTSHVTHHTSHITRHTSHVTRHTSHVTRHAGLTRQVVSAVSLLTLFGSRLIRFLDSMIVVVGGPAPLFAYTQNCLYVASLQRSLYAGAVAVAHDLNGGLRVEVPHEKLNGAAVLNSAWERAVRTCVRCESKSKDDFFPLVFMSCNAYLVRAQ
jgi:hypothetical protein